MTKITHPGKHLILDFWQSENLQDEHFIQQTLQNAAKACNATILAIKLHHFGSGQGVTGMALLAESHISIHTWPETSYAAIDIFMCGNCNPNDAVEPLKKAFNPQKVRITEIDRGSESNSIKMLS